VLAPRGWRASPLVPVEQGGETPAGTV
jgi:hypothetical protein